MSIQNGLEIGAAVAFIAVVGSFKQLTEWNNNANGITKGWAINSFTGLANNRTELYEFNDSYEHIGTVLAPEMLVRTGMYVK